jgi:hypothetical protein
LGVENADGTVALKYLNNHPAIRDGQGLRLTPAG